MKELNRSLTFESLSNYSQIKVVLGSDELDGKYSVNINRPSFFNVSNKMHPAEHMRAGMTQFVFFLINNANKV